MSSENPNGKNPNGTDSAVHPTDLTAFQQRILTILVEDARYGLAIKDALEDYYGDEINHGRLYPNLDELVDIGLVDKTALDKRTNEYRLTAAGLDVLKTEARWLQRHFEAGGGEA